MLLRLCLILINCLRKSKVCTPWTRKMLKFAFLQLFELFAWATNFPNRNWRVIAALTQIQLSVSRNSEKRLFSWFHVHKKPKRTLKPKEDSQRSSHASRAAELLWSHRFVFRGFAVSDCLLVIDFPHNENKFH